jgi:hypothetical protein
MTRGKGVISAMNRLRPASVAGLLLPGIDIPLRAHAGNKVSEDDVHVNNQLRRQRIQLPKAPLDTVLDADRDMEDIWEKSTRTAKSEIEIMRLLRMHSTDMSMGSPSGDGKPVSPSGDVKPVGPPATTPTTPPGTGPTNLPAECLMGRSKEEYIFDLLEPITSSEILNDLSTPQGMAFDFLVNDDPGLEDPCASGTIVQRYGLTSLYFSTQGEEWNDTSGWLGEAQECSWFGVECVDDSDVVTRLLLRKSRESTRCLTS